MKIHRRKGGFSLIECIVAMAVFAIMSLLIVTIFAFIQRHSSVTHHMDQQTDEQAAALEGAGGAPVSTSSGTINFSGGFSITVDGEFLQVGETDDEVNLHYFQPDSPAPSP